MVLISAIIAVTIVSCKNTAVEPQRQTTTAAAVTEKPTEKPKKQPNSVSVGTPMLTIGIGENADLQAHYDGSQPAEDATYSSDRAGVVTIDEAAGRVTGKVEGGAVVTVKSANNKTAHCFVTVKKAPTKVSFPVDKLNMLAGEQTTLTLIPAEGEGFSAVTLTSSDSGVVSIAANGLVTAGKAGTATVTGTTFNGQKATCTVTVLENNGVTDRQTAVDADLLREPGWQFPSVQKVPAGSRVSQYGQSDDGRWIKVKYNDSTGWMYNKAFGEITNYSQFNTRTLPVMADDLLFDVTTDKRAIFDFVYQISYDTNGDNSVENLCVFQARARLLLPSRRHALLPLQPLRLRDLQGQRSERLRRCERALLVHQQDRRGLAPRGRTGVLHPHRRRAVLHRRLLAVLQLGQGSLSADRQTGRLMR